MVSAGAQPTDPVDETPPPASAEQQATYAKAGERLPMSIKFAYGMPNLAGAGMAIPVVVTMTIFSSDVVLLPLGFVPLAFAFARALDPINHTIMGWHTDRPNTRSAHLPPRN